MREIVRRGNASNGFSDRESILDTHAKARGLQNELIQT